jgi:hypothetical protein
MQCKEFSDVLEQQGLSPLPPAAQDHLASCSSCQDFLADLNSIVVVAKEFPAEAAPPQRVWVSLRAQLETEGLIKEPSVVASSPTSDWLQSLRAWLTPRSLATAGVGIALAIAAFLQFHKPNNTENPSVAKQVQPSVQPAVTSTVPTQRAVPQIQAQAQPPVQKSTTKSPLGNSLITEPVLTPPPSLDVYQARSAALSQAETEVSGSAGVGNPALDEALRQNLRTVNEFIAECQAHLKKHPHDMLAREYLNSAYQQKAELLAAMLDSGRSEQ